MIGQLIVSGLLAGSVYALVAIGLNLVFGVMRIINFAHGEYLMLALYGAFWLFRLGVDPYLAILVIVPAMALFGAATERYLVRYTMAAHAHVKIFVTLGLSIALQNLALLFLAPIISASIRPIRPRLYRSSLCRSAFPAWSPSLARWFRRPRFLSFCIGPISARPSGQRRRTRRSPG